MRSLKKFTIDIVRKPPMIFPFIGIFHVLWIFYILWDDRKEPIDIAWLQMAWMAAYSIFWLAACDLRKWGAIGYFIITLADAGIYFAARNNKIDQVYVSDLFLIDGLFSFFLLFYYKKFR